MRPRRHHDDRAIVIVMVLGILAVLAVAGTAFAVFMREENRSAMNTANLVRAELAARAGVEHAIRAIEHALNLYVTPTGALEPGGAFHDDRLADGASVGWYKYFEGTDDIMQFGLGGRLVAGRTFSLSYPVTRKRGEYVVQVEDLDRKVHANLKKWSNDTGTQPPPPADLFVQLANHPQYALPYAAELITESSLADFSCLAEIPRRLGSIGDQKYDFEKCYTAYPPLQASSVHDDTQATSSPVGAGEKTEITLGAGGLADDEHIGKTLFAADGPDADPYPEVFTIVDNTANTVTVLGDSTARILDGTVVRIVAPRPAVNVNTAEQALLQELLFQICSINPAPGRASDLAAYICAKRPFPDRHAFEEALFRVTGDTAVDTFNGKTLDERQFNDVLNSTGCVLGESESAYDEPANPGVYSFDGWAEGDVSWTGPSQTGGTHSDKNGGEVTTTNEPLDNVTWSTELTFTSRFFHIYVLGRGWDEEMSEAVGLKRAHAIYDAAPADGSGGRIIWIRWNLSARGSVAD